MKTKTKIFMVIGLGKIGKDMFNKLKLFTETRKDLLYGFDIDPKAINPDEHQYLLSELSKIHDFIKRNKEEYKEEYQEEYQFIYIINVPTNITNTRKPDFTPFKYLKNNFPEISNDDILINQSTVYPGFTIEFGEELGFNNILYIPERFDETNPVLGLKRILGYKKECAKYAKTAEMVKDIYEIIGFKIMKMTSVENAEASKMLENIQRDVNIALMNEFKMAIDQINFNNILINLEMDEILECAYTKDNFAKYKPGLVGGHCIPFDPYWFIYKAEESGALLSIIKNARLLNDYKTESVAQTIIKKTLQNKYEKIGIKGITYKKGSKDFRYSSYVKIIEALRDLNLKIYVDDDDLTNEELESFCKEYKVKNLRNKKQKVDYIFNIKEKEI